MRRRATIALGILAALVLASTSDAAYDPLGAGKTKLTLDRGFVSFLKRDGVKLSASSGAKRKDNALTLPVSGGNLDPTLGKGEINSEGTLVFQNERGRVPLRDLSVKTTHQPLIAKVGGSQLKVATSSKLSTKREGFGSSFQAKALALSAKVATRLNKKLRPKLPFTEGQPLGTLVAKTQPQLITIVEANKATLAFDPAFLAKLQSHFVSLNPIFPAEHSGATFSFPIAIGGAIAPDGSEGTLRTAGSVELLQLGAGQVFWQELWLDLGAKSDSAEVDVEPTPAFPGKLGRVGVFDLGPTAPASDPRARTVSVSAAPLTLQAQTAATLNQAFAQGQPAFAAGEAVGALSFVAQGQ
jgi:hypothetical protein